MKAAHSTVQPGSDIVLEHLRSLDWITEFKAFLRVTRKPHLSYLDLNPHDFAVFMLFVLVRANMAGLKLWLRRACPTCGKRVHSRFPNRVFNLRAEEAWGHYGFRIVPDLMVFDQNGTVAVCLEIHRAHEVKPHKQKRYALMGMRLVEIGFDGVLKAIKQYLDGQTDVSLWVKREALLHKVRCPRCVSKKPANR